MGLLLILAIVVYLAASVVFIIFSVRAVQLGRPFLESCLAEEGLTVLRCRHVWMYPCRQPTERASCLYRLTAIDGWGRLRTGWACVDGKVWKWEFTPRQLEVQWVRVRETRRPAATAVTARFRPNPLWDAWIDQ